MQRDLFEVFNELFQKLPCPAFTSLEHLQAIVTRDSSPQQHLLTSLLN